MSLSKEQQAFTIDVAKLIFYAESIGVLLTFGDCYRSKSQQLLNFKGYVLKIVNGALKLIKDKVKSWNMNSNHMRRLAVDFNFFIDGKLYYKHEKINELGEFWESLNSKNRWGGHFKKHYDGPHFERNV